MGSICRKLSNSLKRNHIIISSRSKTISDSRKKNHFTIYSEIDLNSGSSRRKDTISLRSDSISDSQKRDFENWLRIDLLDKGQKIKQFTDMVENQYHLGAYDVLGASRNYYTSKVYTKGIENILQGFYSAYENHLPIRLTPDIIWLLIVQGFAQHVNFNAEYLRQKFVNFEGKKKLEIIISKYHSYKQMKSKDYEDLFVNLTEKIKENIGEELINTIDFNFTTSNKITKIVGYASIMSDMKKYFEFKGLCHMCNYPYIILDGKLEDWESILKKTKDLAKYDLERWVTSLEKPLNEIIKTKKGKINKEFWKKILYPDKIDKKIEIATYKYKTIQVDGIKGWLLLFFPYFKNGHYRYDIYLKTKDIWRLPNRLLKTPLLMKSDDEGEIPMTIYSGFLGMNVDKEKDNLVTAEIGWFVKEKSKERIHRHFFFESDSD